MVRSRIPNIAAAPTTMPMIMKAISVAPPAPLDIIGLVDTVITSEMLLK